MRGASVKAGWLPAETARRHAGLLDITPTF